MIFVHDKIYAKVWSVKQFDKYIDLQVTTGEKGDDGNYINSGWFPRLIGHAFNNLKGKVKEGDRIIITKCKLSNERYIASDGSKKSTFKFLVLEAEIEGSNSASQSAPATTVAQTKAPAVDDSNPW